MWAYYNMKSKIVFCRASCSYSHTKQLQTKNDCFYSPDFSSKTTGYLIILNNVLIDQNDFYYSSFFGNG